MSEQHQYSTVSYSVAESEPSSSVLVQSSLLMLISDIY
jgi:hypothetical protein